MSGKVQNAGISDQVIATSKKPACRDTFLGNRNVEKNINEPANKVIDAACKKASVAPSPASMAVNRQVAITPLKPIVTKPKIWMIVRMTFMRAFRKKQNMQD